MRTVIAHLLTTLDGVVELDAVVNRIIELRDKEVFDDFFAKVVDEDAMLLGRVTYQDWAGYWPTSAVEPFAGHINGVQKYIASRTLKSVEWATRGNARLLQGDIAQSVTALKQQAGGNIGVHGSPSLVESLLQAGVLDLLRLEIYPIIAGTGKRLFAAGTTSKQMTLVDSKTARNGVVILTYRPSTTSG